MCILGEPTEGKVVLGHFGSLWLRLSVAGNFIHTAFSEGRRDENSILRMQDVLAAVLDCDARAVAKQDDVSGFADHLVQLIDLVLGAEDELVERLARLLQLALRQDARRPAIGRIDSILTCRSLPGARDLPYR